MRQWIFHFCRNALRLPLGIFIRKVHFDGKENFKKGVPVLLACNHPNSFLDGVIFEHLSGRSVYTLARGDAFLSPVANYILRGMRLLPIFRATDASAEIARKGNANTKDEIYDLFTKQHSVLIFSEGIGYPEKALRRLKKGTGQIAADSVRKSDFTMDLYILPTALNYSKFWTKQQTIHVTYGEPIRVLDYIDLINEDEKGFIELATEKIQISLEKNVVLTKGDHRDEKEFAQEMLINENYHPFKFKIKDKWDYSIGKINTMSADLAEEIKNYKSELLKYAVLDSNVGNQSIDFVSAFIAIFTTGVSLPLYIVWSLLWYAVDKTIKSKIKNIVFWDSVVVGLMMIVGLIITSIAGAILNSFIPGYWPWLFLALGTYGAICWFRLVDSFPHLWKELKWMSLNKNERQSILGKRNAILSSLK